MINICHTLNQRAYVHIYLLLTISEYKIISNSMSYLANIYIRIILYCMCKMYFIDQYKCKT